jgi:hypothetical protein
MGEENEQEEIRSPEVEVYKCDLDRDLLVFPKTTGEEKMNLPSLYSSPSNKCFNKYI